MHYPIAGGTKLNIAATRDTGATHVVSGEPVARSRVLESFPSMATPARRILELGRGWRSWVLCYRNPIDEWTDRRVTLLGDAAHPMLQYAAQGACMALEDAAHLAHVLGDSPENLPDALDRYSAQRQQRTRHAQLVSRAMSSNVYHAAGDEARSRNRRLSTLSEHQLHDMVAPLHGEPAPLPTL